MTVGELKAELDDYGDHLPVILALGGHDDEWPLAEVDTGNRYDEDGANVPSVILVSQIARIT